MGLSDQNNRYWEGNSRERKLSSPRYFRIMDRYYETYEVFLLASFFFFLFLIPVNIFALITPRSGLHLLLQIFNGLVILIMNIHLVLTIWDWFFDSSAASHTILEKWKKEIAIIWFIVLPIMTAMLLLFIYNILATAQNDGSVINTMVNAMVTMFYLAVEVIVALAVYLYDCLDLLFNPKYKEKPSSIQPQ